MKVLDKYIIKEFLAPLGLVVLGISTLVLLVQAVDNLPRLRETGASNQLILLYYLTDFPFLVTQVIPIAMMLAALIALGSLARSSELTAARAGGVSAFRIALPILVVGLLLSLALFAVSETLVPKASYYSRYIKKVKIEKRDMNYDVAWRSNMAKSLSGDRQLFCKEYDSAAGVMREVIIITRKDGRIAERIDAERMVYEKASGWTLSDGVERIFDESGEEKALRNFSRWRVDIAEIPEDFMVDSDKREQDLLQLSMAELSDIIQVLKKTGASYRKELICLHLRVSYPLSCFILALLGVSLPFLFPFGRRAMAGAALGVLVALGCGMFYLVFIQVGISLGKSGNLPILLSAWLGNLVFLTVGAGALWKANR
ncbi:MAG: LptF/LptG family permease [candidate division FCPU426 bacterium]